MYIIDNDGTPLYDNVSSAQEFNRYFASLNTIDNKILLAFLSVTKDLNLSIIYFDVISVTRAIKSRSLQILHKIPNFYLKNNIASIITNFIPEIWKITTILPAHKKGATDCISNNRLISLISVVSKLMESIIVDQLYNCLYSNHIISPYQFGFRRNSSTVHQLIDSHYNWVFQQNKGCPTDVILLDFSKAFDSVVHAELFIKLSQEYILLA